MPPKKKGGKKADKSKKTKQPGKAAQAPPVKTAMERLFGDEFLGAHVLLAASACVNVCTCRKPAQWSPERVVRSL